MCADEPEQLAGLPILFDQPHYHLSIEIISYTAYQHSYGSPRVLPSWKSLYVDMHYT